MSLAIGALSAVSVGSQSNVISAPAATGGSGTVSVVLYQSTITGFTPGSPANAVGTASAVPAAASTFTPASLVPGVTYYYTAIATDSTPGTPLTATSAQLTVTQLLAIPTPNQYALSPTLGMLDLRFNGNTISVQFDPAASGTLQGGQAVIWSTAGSNSLGGLDPLVAPSTADADLVCGFVNYNIKNAVFSPGDRLEISMFGNVMYLTAIGAIPRGTQVNSHTSGVAGGAIGGVRAAVSGSPWVGYCLDQAATGTLCRVWLQTPANSVLHS